jgi:hypothetical protein
MMEQRSGKISYADIAKQYNGNGEIAKGSEPITENLVRNALQVHKEILQVPRLKAMVMETDDRFGKQSPHNSILKLQLYYNRTKLVFDDLRIRDAAQIVNGLQWVFQAVHDRLVAGLLKPDDFAKRAISGESSGNKGLVDLLLLKFFVLEHLLHTWLPTLGVPIDIVVGIQSALKDFNEYRKHCGWPNKAEDWDLSWQAGWKAGHRELCGLIEESRFCCVSHALIILTPSAPETTLVA